MHIADLTLSALTVCGSENEVAPIPTEDDHFDLSNRKMESGPINAYAQKSTVWIEVVLGAQDQLCQRLAFGLSKIFATSTETNSDSSNSETNIGVYDNFVNACFSTYRDVMKRMSFNQEMSEQCKSIYLAFTFPSSPRANALLTLCSFRTYDNTSDFQALTIGGCRLA